MLVHGNTIFGVVVPVPVMWVSIAVPIHAEKTLHPASNDRPSAHWAAPPVTSGGQAFWGGGFGGRHNLASIGICGFCGSDLHLSVGDLRV